MIHYVCAVRGANPQEQGVMAIDQAQCNERRFWHRSQMNWRRSHVQVFESLPVFYSNSAPRKSLPQHQMLKKEASRRSYSRNAEVRFRLSRLAFVELRFGQDRIR